MLKPVLIAGERLGLAAESV
jgi:hypothetical protein